jgi:hypothetical protein
MSGAGPKIYNMKLIINTNLHFFSQSRSNPGRPPAPGRSEPGPGDLAQPRAMTFAHKDLYF